MVEALITFYGATDGSSATGDFSLDSPVLYSKVTYIRVPKGMKLKIWCKRIAGAVPTEVIFNYTNDVTAGTPTWKPIGHEYLVSPGEITLEKRRPVVVVGRTGKEAVKISWSQSTAGNAWMEVEVEFTED